MKSKIPFSFILCACLTLLCFLKVNAQNDADENYTVYKYPNGNISSEGILLDGKPNGYWKTYYQDGTLQSEGNRRDFLLDSVWLFFNNEGVVTNSISYKQGKKHGETIIYTEGSPSVVEYYANNLLQGNVCYLYPNGNIWKTIPYENGKESGKGFEYAEDGRIITLLNYQDGYLKSSEQINRYDKHDNRRGLWVDFHKNMNVKYEGTYLNDLKNGIFKTFDTKGDLVSIEKYTDGILNTEGGGNAVILDLRNTYYDDGSVKSTGGYVNSVKEGTHRIYDKEGSIISGIIYSRGEITAEGVIDQNGLFQGPWKLYYPGGELKAEGEYIDSKKEGDWIFYHKNGAIEHRGKYKENLPRGDWKWYFDNENIRRAEFYRRGKEDGSSVEYNLKGDIISQGEFINGLKEGEWFYNVGDHTEKGSYRDGERTGDWIYEYMDGQIQYEGEYVADLPIGKHTWYYNSGQVKREGKYNSGVKTGTWKTYDEEGIVVLTIKYKHGEEFKINGKKVESSNNEEEMVQ